MIRWRTMSFYMPNAHPEVLRLQNAVFTTLQEPLEQVQDTCSHGEFLTRALRQNLRVVDAMVFFDIDCIPLKTGVVKQAVQAAISGNMIIGCAQQANHIEERQCLAKQRCWPWPLRKAAALRRHLWRRLGWDPFRFKNPLIYAGPCFLVVPTAIYEAAGQPNLVETERADVAGELTIACRERGIGVKCLQPTFCHVPKWKIGNVKCFGLGTIYENGVFHAFQSRINDESISLFIEYCGRVIDQHALPQIDI